MSTHLDSCVSSVTQKISQNRLRIMTPLRPQATGDPAFNLAVLPAHTAHTSGFFPMLPGSKPTLVLLWPISIQGSRLAPARAVRLAEDSALSAASVLGDCIAASFTATIAVPDGVLR